MVFEVANLQMEGPPERCFVNKAGLTAIAGELRNNPRLVEKISKTIRRNREDTD